MIIDSLSSPDEVALGRSILCCRNFVRGKNKYYLSSIRSNTISDEKPGPIASINP